MGPVPVKSANNIYDANQDNIPRNFIQIDPATSVNTHI